MPSPFSHDRSRLRQPRLRLRPHRRSPDPPVEWQIANEPAAVKRLALKIERAALGAIRSRYEAGVCGYTLQRQLEAAQVPCTVIAPALIPRKAGRAREDGSPGCAEAGRALACGLADGSAPAPRPPRRRGSRTTRAGHAVPDPARSRRLLRLRDRAHDLGAERRGRARRRAQAANQAPGTAGADVRVKRRPPRELSP